MSQFKFKSKAEMTEYLEAEAVTIGPEFENIDALDERLARMRRLADELSVFTQPMHEEEVFEKVGKAMQKIEKGRNLSTPMAVIVHHLTDILEPTSTE